MTLKREFSKEELLHLKLSYRIIRSWSVMHSKFQMISFSSFR